MLKALLYIVPIGLALYALIDLSRSEAVERTGLPRIGWVAVIVVLLVVGPLAWILISRSRRSPGVVRGPSGAPRPTPGARPTAGSRPWPTRRPGPVAPDDDPDFLWRLDQDRRRHTTRPGQGPAASHAVDPTQPGTPAPHDPTRLDDPVPPADDATDPAP